MDLFGSMAGIKREIRLCYGEVPSYLHRSVFFKSLDADPQSVFFIPQGCWKEDDSVRNIEDFTTILRVMHFWGLDTIPSSVLQFCRSVPIHRWEHISRSVLDPDTSKMLKEYFNYQYSIVSAILTGRKEIVADWLENHGPNSPGGDIAFQVTAFQGKVEILQELHVLGYPWREDVCESAARSGHLPCLQYLHTHGCPWDATTSISAARGGHLQCLRYAHENHCPWDKRVCNAATEGLHMDCLQYACAHGCPWDERVTLTRNMEILSYALARGCPIHQDAAFNALRENDFTRLQLLREYGATFEMSHACIAAEEGNLALLHQLAEQGGLSDGSAVTAAASHRYLPCVRYLIEDQALFMDDQLFGMALLSSYYDMVVYLVDVGCTCDFVLPPDKHPTDIFIYNIDDAKLLRCLQYVVEHGFSLNNTLIEVVLQNELPLCHKYFREEDIQITNSC